MILKRFGLLTGVMVVAGCVSDYPPSNSYSYGGYGYSSGYSSYGSYPMFGPPGYPPYGSINNNQNNTQVIVVQPDRPDPPNIRENPAIQDRDQRDGKKAMVIDRRNTRQPDGRRDRPAMRNDDSPSRNQAVERERRREQEEERRRRKKEDRF